MIRGSIVGLVTPMHTGSLEVDWAALRKLVDWHIEQGTNSIVAVGTTGESATLDVEEHAKVISAVVKQAAGRIPIIAGTGANSTREAIELTQAAADAGADACLLVTPYYNKPTQEGLYLHYKAIAEAVAIDKILYNVPGRTACDMLPATVQRLSAIDNIVGIKEATGDLGRAQQILDIAPEGFAGYSGDDAPKLMSEMCAAALAGNAELAASIDAQLSALHKNLFIEANPIPVKWAVSQLGLIDNALRLPMTPLSADKYEVVRAAMRSAKLL